MGGWGEGGVSDAAMHRLCMTHLHNAQLSLLDCGLCEKAGWGLVTLWGVVEGIGRGSVGG